MVASVCFLLLVLGAAFLLSPFMEKREMKRHQDELLESIQEGDGAILLDQRFATSPVDYYDTDVPTIAEDAPTDGEDVLITGIGVLSIERIGLVLPVTEGATDAQLKISACHVSGTAEIGGNGNAVIAGHRSYTYGHLFNRLDELEAGDLIVYTGADGEEIRFAVTGMVEATPEEAATFWQPAGRQWLTLYTCTPVKTATHRLLVQAERV